jgi:hypothetical protein
VRTRAAQNGRRRSGAGAGAALIPLRSATHSGFERDFERLKGAVATACAEEVAWQAKVGAAISAVLEFAAAEPATARELTARGQYSSHRSDEVVAHFTRLLSDVVPARGPAVSTNEAIVECVAVLIRGQVLAGRAAELPGLASELVAMVLLPYSGSPEAERWAARTAQRHA